MDASESEVILADLRQRVQRHDWSGIRSAAELAPASFTIEFGLIVGEAELRQGEPAAAQVRLAAVAEQAERRHDPAAFRRAVNMLGVARFEMGDLTGAESAFERALADATRQDDHLTAARATNNLGAIANVRGRHDTALGHYRVALPAYQRLGFAAGMGETSHNIAITLRDMGQLDEADRYERRAIDFAADAENVRLAAMARAGRADISLRRGEAAVGQAEARKAVAEYRLIGDVLGEADALRVQGLALVALGELAEAEAVIRGALALSEQSGATLIQAESRAAALRVALANGDRAWALAEYQRAMMLYQSLGAEAEMAQLTEWWAAQPPG